MKKVNGGAPQTPKNAPSRPQPGVPGPELNRLMSADMHPADAALALRENQAHLILSRAAVDGVDLQPASSTRSGRVRSPSVGEVHGALDVMSRAAKKSGARQGVLANASMMKLSRGLQATEASAATLCLSNMLSILSANLGDYGNFAIGEQMAKEAASRMVALEVFATAQTATTRVPKAADPNLRLDVDAAASVVAQRIGHLTAADAKRQADDMVQALCAGLHSLGPRTPRGPCTQPLPIARRTWCSCWTTSDSMATPSTNWPASPC